MSNKIGAAIITHNREKTFSRCINSVPEPDVLIVVNDGTPYDKKIYPSKVKHVIQHEVCKNVGVAKNNAIRYLMGCGCGHIFLIEDDIEIRRDDVYEKYIKTAEASGIYHLNYKCDEFNGIDHSRRPPRLTVGYGSDLKIDLHYNLSGAFTYFRRDIIENIGLHDERFYNAMEHVELTYRAIKRGFHPPFWWFADVHNSNDFIVDMKDASLVSTILGKNEENFKRAIELFKFHHGAYPTEVKSGDQKEVIEILKAIKKLYAIK